MRFIATFILIALNASAANWYVRVGGAGGKTGVDWNNAWDIGGGSGIVWASVSAGDTIWLAGGTYTSTLTYGKSGTAGNTISVKRVLSTDATPVAAAGWSGAFDSLVIIPGTISFASGPQYTTLDGRNEYGIQVTFGNGSVGIQVLAQNSATTSTNVLIQYVECVGPGITTSEADAISAPPSAVCYGITIRHCWLHNTDTLIKRQAWLNGLVEYCKLTDTTYQAGGPHPDIVYSYPCTNTIFRYNTISNSAGDGVFYSYGYSTGEYWYGNQFVNWSQYIFYLRTTVDTGGGNYGTFYLYNNTFADFSGGGYGGAVTFTNVDTASKVENNIFDVPAAGFGLSLVGTSNPTYDYNYDVTGTSGDTGAHGLTGARPFVATGNVHLNAASGPVNHGLTLTVDGYINVDMDGNTRGADGTWDIGAYEYTSGGGGGSTYIPPSIQTWNLNLR